MMRYSPCKIIIISSLILSGCVQKPAPVSGPTIDERVKQLEDRVSNQKNLLDVQNKMEQNQREIRQLRGSMEELQHKLTRLKKQQQSSYQDVDQRLQQIIGESPSSGFAPPPSASASDTPSATTMKGSQAYYYQALDTLNAGRYKQAIQQFQSFLTQYPDEPLASNAQYWQAEAYYVIRNFSAARAGFKKVINNYHHSPKIADALLKSGFIDYEQSRWKQARKQLNQVIKKYPDSSASRLAQQRLKKMSQERH